MGWSDSFKRDYYKWSYKKLNGTALKYAVILFWIDVVEQKKVFKINVRMNDVFIFDQRIYTESKEGMRKEG